MALHLIGVIPGTEGILGFRLLDIMTGACKDLSYTSVLEALKAKRAKVVGIEFENGKLVPTNGAFDRYPNPFKQEKQALVIINEISDAGYTVSDVNGRVMPIVKDDVIDYGEKFGIANGLVQELRGTKFIRSFRGGFEKGMVLTPVFTFSGYEMVLKNAVQSRPTQGKTNVRGAGRERRVKQGNVNTNRVDISAETAQKLAPVQVPNSTLSYVNEDNAKANVEQAPKRRGRPPRTAVATAEPTAPKRRGRPPKNSNPTDADKPTTPEIKPIEVTAPLDYNKYSGIPLTDAQLCEYDAKGIFIRKEMDVADAMVDLYAGWKEQSDINWELAQSYKENTLRNIAIYETITGIPGDCCRYFIHQYGIDIYRVVSAVDKTVKMHMGRNLGNSGGVIEFLEGLRSKYNTVGEGGWIYFRITDEDKAELDKYFNKHCYNITSNPESYTTVVRPGASKGEIVQKRNDTSKVRKRTEIESLGRQIMIAKYTGKKVDTKQISTVGNINNNLDKAVEAFIQLNMKLVDNYELETRNKATKCREIITKYGIGPEEMILCLIEIYSNSEVENDETAEIRNLLSEIKSIYRPKNKAAQSKFGYFAMLDYDITKMETVFRKYCCNVPK